ncbi:MAG: DEAD/DEAH box helicase family protein [Candidatus Anstonellales archaeon]
MWTLINSSDFNAYINENPRLKEYEDYIKLYTTKKGKIILPRLIYKNHPSSRLTTINGNGKERASNLNFKGELTDEQKEIVDKIIHRYNRDGWISGIIHGKPGIGKTVLSIYIASKLNKIALIVVDNKKLAEQWIDEIKKFTDCDDNDIGKLIAYKDLPKNKKIYIALVQTLLSRLKRNANSIYNDISSLGIGLVVYDECHKTTTGIQYARVSILFDTKNFIGLSATPYVSGINRVLLENTIGNILVTNKKYDLKPNIRIIEYKSDIPESVIKRIKTVSDYNGARSIYNSEISNSKIYLDLICNLINKIVQDENRRVIVICVTISQIKRIHEYLSNNFNIESKLFYSKNNEIDKTRDRVLIATYKYASHGFDYKELTDIIIASPLSGRTSLTQCIGRILRKMEGKVQPNVYDIIDNNISFLFGTRSKISILTSEFKCGVEFYEYEYRSKRFRDKDTGRFL